MRNTLLIAVLLAATASASAAEYKTETITSPNGVVEVRTPVTTERCEMREKSNLGNAALGAGIGYAGARAMVGGRNSNRWGLGAAAAGALIGSQLEKDKVRVCDNVLTGWEVRTIKNGRVTESFEPVR